MKIFFFMIFVVFSLTVWADDCPIKYEDSNYVNKVRRAIQATHSCYDAATLAKTCSLGASGDRIFVPIAERKCGLNFWSKLTNQEKKIYNHLQSKCDKKYKVMDGSMYISFNAFCHLEVAELYSEFYTPIESY